MSSPTRLASTTRVPSSRIVPALTVSSRFFSTDRDSPVKLASFTSPVPRLTWPSTGIRSPALTRTRSPSSTRSMSVTSPVASSTESITSAVCGAISVKDLTAARVLRRVKASKTSPRLKSQTTIAPSVYSPMMAAPMMATATRSSIEITRYRRALKARRIIGIPAKIVTIIINNG